MHGAVQITRHLVAIPSVNPMGKGLTGELYSEKGMVRYIADYLQTLGISAEVFGADPDHPNLTAFIDAGKPETIMLEAHMDTVSQEQMSINPFDPVIRDGRIYGRGSCDTKASLATYLYAVGELVRGKKSLKRNIRLAFVKDEEYAFSGARELVDRGIRADFAIVGEPTELNLIYAHKGLCRFFIHTKGSSCHSSMPWLGENAIYKMGALLGRIEDYGRHLAKTVHPDLGCATVNVGRISGGQTVNTVPAACSIELDNRLLPGMDYDSILRDLKTWLGESADYTIEPPYLLALGVQNHPDDPHNRALRQACEANGVQPAMQTAHYATDAAIYQQAGIPCVVFGPGNIQQAHTADEHIAIADIEKAADILITLLAE
ncbi:M20 family metallopeptidase [Flavihumibacter stibioxidans]|uniref:Probable succinyl-diaminopimelate desuccinylase n=1 Tax=Flavihumibacter stibioxidans TaxID=1834163 RepID=A0ABR7M9T9_9BACT|nr:M20 family metallopeptidase [Flavihumibacter stibioxidans]MBC6491391.1 hypothetical protein [Flavihumibacter stibioxidans]